jgi:hypothetical protein
MSIRAPTRSPSPISSLAGPKSLAMSSATGLNTDSAPIFTKSFSSISNTHTATFKGKRVFIIEKLKSHPNFARNVTAMRAV